MRLDHRMPEDSRRRVEVIKDPILRALLTRSPQEIETWVTDNVNNLQAAKTVLAALAKAVAILGKRELAE